jgi:thioredoxin reductase (NADPH)
MQDLIIIGGGLAAYSAAFYAGRRGLQVLVLAKDIGGQVNYTDVIENFPGLATIGGYQLVQKIKKQAEEWGAVTEIQEVKKIKPVVEGDPGFVVQTFGKQYKSRAVILAFGKTPMDLGVVGEADLKGRGVSYCATCDAPLYKGKTVVVAGYGDLGLETALLCAKYAKKVYTLSKSDKLVGHSALVKKVLQHKKIALVSNIEIQALSGEQKLESVDCRDLASGQQSRIKCEGLFVSIGYVVNSGWLKGTVALDEHGHVVVDGGQATNVPGVFAAGDVTNRTYKQAVISAAEGAASALAAHDWMMRDRGSEGITSDWTEIKKIK